MQGPSIPLGLRLKVAITFAFAFIAAAVVAFASAAFAGTALHVTDVPIGRRSAIAAVILMTLALADAVAIRRSTYCPISWRRQTPRRLMRRYPPVLVALAWGLDTGLAVTTFRVAALTWGALAVTFLGISQWWIGIGYGLGFVVPLMIVIFTGRVGRSAMSGAPDDPGLEALLRKRPRAQLGSAMLLVSGGIVLLSTLLRG